MKRREEWRFDKPARPTDSLFEVAEAEDFLLATVDCNGGIDIVGEDERLAEANRRIQARMTRAKENDDKTAPIDKDVLEKIVVALATFATIIKTARVNGRTYAVDSPTIVYQQGPVIITWGDIRAASDAHEALWSSKGER